MRVYKPQGDYISWGVIQKRKKRDHGNNGHENEELEPAVKQQAAATLRFSWGFVDFYDAGAVGVRNGSLEGIKGLF